MGTSRAAKLLFGKQIHRITTQEYFQQYVVISVAMQGGTSHKAYVLH